MESPPHVLILGGSGAVGCRLAARFRAQAPCVVEATSSRDCDLTDGASIQQLRARIRKGTLVIFSSTIARLREDSLSAFHRNLAMAENVSHALSDTQAGALVFLSTIDVYGRPPREVPLTEQSPIDPAGYYGLSKFVSERILQDKLAGQLPLAILRLPGVFSLDDTDTSVLGRLFNRLRNNEPVELTGGGHQHRSYLHVDDLFAIILAIHSTKWSGLLNASSTGSRSLREMTELMREYLGSTSRIDSAGDARSEFDLQLNDNALRQAFPDVAPRSLEQCLQELEKKVF